MTAGRRAIAEGRDVPLRIVFACSYRESLSRRPSRKKPGAPPNLLLVGWDSLVSCRVPSILHRSSSVMWNAGSRLIPTLSPRAGERMGHPALGVLHRGRACCNTWLRNFGGNPFGVNTHTHRDPQQLLSVDFQTSNRKQAGGFRRINQQIKIALIRVGAAQNRSEDARVR